MFYVKVMNYLLGYVVLVDVNVVNVFIVGYVYVGILIVVFLNFASIL